jgi:serine/threonine-protein kinase
MASLKETLFLRPGSTEGSRVTPSDPTEFQKSVAQRLGIFALVIATVVTLVIALDLVLYYVFGLSTSHAFGPTHVVKGVLVLLSAATWGLSRWARIAPPTMIRVGFAYEVAGSFLVAFQTWLAGRLIHDDTLTISWLCVWIVMFPLIVPTTPWKALLVSVVSASMGPLCYSFCVVGGKAPVEPTAKLVASFLPNYVAAALAVVPAYLLHGLGRSLHVAERKLKELGSYQLVELLGQGGMGEVWRAEHRMLARPAAVKIVKLDALEDGAPEAKERLLRRFEVEALATASLHSPHTVQLYDFGVTQEGTFYYVMELLNGLDLESLVSRFGVLPPARTVSILRQACSSLAEAHAAGMVHRDIKPANIYLCRLGLEHDWVKVLDFGLVAKPKGCEHAHDSKLTAVNTIVGTPSFMAPEMAEGRPDIDGRADLYALGCVAYWLLTGTQVFEGHDKTPMKLLMDHIGTRPDPPSRRLQRPIPPALEAIVLRCLEKDPRDRPPSATELSRLLAECPVDGHWTDDDARRWWGAHLKELAAKEVDSHAFASTVIKQPAAV